jgi:hypothetical protein
MSNSSALTLEKSLTPRTIIGGGSEFFSCSVLEFVV